VLFGEQTPPPEQADHALHTPLLHVRVCVPQFPQPWDVGPVHVQAPQSTSCAQLFFAGPQGTAAQVVLFASGTHWQLDGEPTQLSLAAHDVQLAAWQPCVTSVGTQRPLQFFVLVWHVPTWHVVPLQTNVPAPGLGHEAALQLVSPHPYVGSARETHVPSQSL
jgi:hypothetical protein